MPEYLCHTLKDSSSRHLKSSLRSLCLFKGIEVAGIWRQGDERKETQRPVKVRLGQMRERLDKNLQNERRRATALSKNREEEKF